MVGSNKTNSAKAQGGAMVLLDTSAFIALSRADLANARHRGWYLTASPWCFLEQLCHLDEGDSFARAKGYLMKFRGVEVVDKPLDRAVAAGEPGFEKRIWASDLVYGALAAIDGANSMDDLNRSLSVDIVGNRRALSVDNARQQLDEQEARFQDFMTTLIVLLRSGQVRADSQDEKYTAIMSMVASGGTHLSDTPDLDYAAADKDQVFACSYVYWAYVLLQANMLKQVGAETCEENDFEDGQLCAYVPLDRPMWIVAGDKHLRCRIAEARAVLIDVGLGDRAAFEPANPDLLLQGGPS